MGGKRKRIEKGAVRLGLSGGRRGKVMEIECLNGRGRVMTIKSCSCKGSLQNIERARRWNAIGNKLERYWALKRSRGDSRWWGLFWTKILWDLQREGRRHKPLQTPSARNRSKRARSTIGIMINCCLDGKTQNGYNSHPKQQTKYFVKSKDRYNYDVVLFLWF